MLRRGGGGRRLFDESRAHKNHVDLPFLSDGFVRTIEVIDLGDVGLYAGDAHHSTPRWRHSPALAAPSPGRPASDPLPEHARCPLGAMGVMIYELYGSIIKDRDFGRGVFELIIS